MDEIPLERWERQNRTFITRSGETRDIEVYVWHAAQCEEKVKSFLRRMAPLARRWSQVTICHPKAESLMQEFVLTRYLPRLWSLRNCFHVQSPLSGFEVPSLSHVSGVIRWDHLELPVISRLTTVTLEFSISIEVPLAAMTRALYSMKNLWKLSLVLGQITEISAQGESALSREEILPAHSVHINILNISLRGYSEYHIVCLLYNCVSHLKATFVTLSLHNIRRFARFLFDSERKFLPYGSNITIIVRQSTDQDNTVHALYLLNRLLDDCGIVHTVNIVAPTMEISDTEERPKNTSIRSLRLKHCHALTEKQLDILAGMLESGGDDEGLQSLEVISCWGVRERYMIGLKDRLGDRLTWIK